MPTETSNRSKTYRFNFSKHEDGKRSTLTIMKESVDEKGKTVTDIYSQFQFTDPSDLSALLSVLWSEFIEHSSSSVEKTREYNLILEDYKRVQEKRSKIDKLYFEYMSKMQEIEFDD